MDIWLEQGLLGLIAWGWLLAAAARKVLPALRRPRDGSSGQAAPPVESDDAAWIAAALAALAIILLHGLVDDAFYGSRGVLLLFLPFAILARKDGERRETKQSHLSQKGRQARPSWAAVAAFAVLLLLLLLPTTRAMVQANLGALSQTRAELSVYRWPDYPIQDALRRQLPGSPPAADLAPAIARYRAALALDPSNATANRRLGQIELSLGDYEPARAHLEAAYRAAPWQRPTRQLLAETYAITGRTEQAAELLRSVDLSDGQLDLRKWWYDVVGTNVSW